MADREREIEVGFLCENPECHEPIEDSRPIDVDWRIPKGRTKRLCPKCAAVEDLTGRTLEKLDRSIDAINKMTSLFDRFTAEGLGPRGKMRRARDER